MGGGSRGICSRRVSWELSDDVVVLSLCELWDGCCGKGNGKGWGGGVWWPSVGADGRRQTAVLGSYGEGPCGYRSNWGNATRDWGRNGNQNPMAMRSRSDFPCRPFQAIPSWMVFSTRYFRPSTSPRGSAWPPCPGKAIGGRRPCGGAVTCRRSSQVVAFPTAARSLKLQQHTPRGGTRHMLAGRERVVKGPTSPLASTFCPDPTISNDACQSAHTTCVKLNLSGGHAHRAYRPFSPEVV